MKFKGLGHAVSVKSDAPLPAPVSTAHPFHGPEYLCEFLGTAIMVFVGLSAVAIDFGHGSPVTQLIPDARLRLLLTAFFFSSGGTCVVYSYLGKRSGGHLNPAVTFSFWLMKRVPTGDALAYVISQCIGATLGAWFVLKCWGELAVSTRLGITMPGLHLSWWEAFAAEVIMTFTLVLAILSGLKWKCGSHYAGLLVGLLVVALVYIGAPISGASLNPARSLGPAMVLQTFIDLWIYWAAPPLGAALAVSVYKLWWE